MKPSVLLFPRQFVKFVKFVVIHSVRSSSFLPFFLSSFLPFFVFHYHYCTIFFALLLNIVKPTGGF